jgi:LacI family transcriptional regulator
MNNVPTVDPKLSKRVWSVINRLGYIPNTQARALVSGRSKLFGIIISDITNPFFPELVQGFEESAVEVGYETLIGSTNYDLPRMELCVQRMLERKVEGVAVMTFGIEEPLLERLAAQGIPMVFIDLAPAQKAIAAIRVDYDKGIAEAVQHLAALGHRRIAFISGPRHLHSAEARLHAFRSAMAAVGLKVPERYLFEGSHTVEMGMTGAEELLALKERPSAIVCSNDMTAIGVMHAVARTGLRIPDDISLIGFDDIRFAQFMLPPLTTVCMSGREIAASAVAALKACVDQGPEAAITPAGVQTRLVIRRSTGVPFGEPTPVAKKKSKR